MIRDCFKNEKGFCQVLDTREFGGKKWITFREIPSFTIQTVPENEFIGEPIHFSFWEKELDKTLMTGSLRWWIWDDGTSRHYIAAEDLPQACGIVIGIIWYYDDVERILDNLYPEDFFPQEMKDLTDLTDYFYDEDKIEEFLKMVEKTITPGYLWCV